MISQPGDSRLSEINGTSSNVPPRLRISGGWSSRWRAEPDHWGWPLYSAVTLIAFVWAIGTRHWIITFSIGELWLIVAFIRQWIKNRKPTPKEKPWIKTQPTALPPNTPREQEARPDRCND